MASSSYSFSARRPKSASESQTSPKAKTEHTLCKKIHFLVNLIRKRTSIIHIPSRDQSHINSHLEMERKNWGKERRGDSIRTTTHMQLKREATQANKLSRRSHSKEKSHCTRMLKWDCSIPGQNESGLQPREMPSPCPGLLQPLLPYNQALPAGSLLYKSIMKNTF